MALRAAADAKRALGLAAGARTRSHARFRPLFRGVDAELQRLLSVPIDKRLDSAGPLANRRESGAHSRTCERAEIRG